MPRGQRAFIIPYVLFLAFVLPFICWGAMADPGHPHSGPHFVFTDPPETRALIVRLDQLRGDICGSPDANIQIAAPFTPRQEPSDRQPVGQSVPDTVLALLMLAIVGGWVYAVRLPRNSQYVTPHRAAHLHALRVPTPPPKYLPALNG